MKLTIAVIICFMASHLIFSQTFKEVKTAQDVIDNYIEAVGGKSALEEVKTIRMKGSIEGMGQGASLNIFFSNDYFYLEISSAMFQMKQAADYNNKKVWSVFGSSTKDMTSQELAKSKKNIESALWQYVLNPEKFGIKYEMLQNEKVNGNDVYVIDFKTDDSVVSTNYYDTKTFMKLRQVSGSDDSEYSDIREVGSSKVKMPYAIKNQSGDVVFSEIKLNEKFDKKLLKKPEKQ